MNGFGFIQYDNEADAKDVVPGTHIIHHHHDCYLCRPFFSFVLFLKLTCCFSSVAGVLQHIMAVNSKVKLSPCSSLAATVIILAMNTLVVRIAASLALGVLLLG